MLKQPPNGPGLVVVFDPKRDLGLRMGVQSPNNSGSTLAEKVFAILELDYHSHLLFAREGNYRLWGRIGRSPEALDRATWGIGVSLDQQLTPTLTAFARYGLSRTEGEGRSAYAWSVGFEVRAPFSTRIKDRTGIAFSSQKEAAGSERIGEWYYNVFLTDHLSLTLDLQWLFSGPNQVTGGKNRNIMIPGLRATVAF